MIVGADHLSTIVKNLKSMGIGHIEHITGRNGSDRKKFSIPLATQLVIVLVDFVNHTTARNIKEEAKAKGVPLVFAKRSWCSIQNKLVECGYQCDVKNGECAKRRNGGCCQSSVRQRPGT